MRRATFRKEKRMSYLMEAGWKTGFPVTYSLNSNKQIAIESMLGGWRRWRKDGGIWKTHPPSVALVPGARGGVPVEPNRGKTVQDSNFRIHFFPVNTSPNIPLYILIFQSTFYHLLTSVSNRKVTFKNKINGRLITNLSQPCGCWSK